jgi:hypothetical protein
MVSTMSEPASAAAGQPEPGTPPPPATFNLLVFSLRTQAELHLGLLHFDDRTEKPEPDLGAARHSIDMLAMLQEKTRGNLTLEEQRLIDNSLTELRFRFVQAVEDNSRSKQS